MSNKKPQIKARNKYAIAAKFRNSAGSMMKLTQRSAVNKEAIEDELKELEENLEEKERKEDVETA